ncbi:hypothetical protein E2C01_001213 [Portunus trituberculatus]|uniref:Uncharacterized protein n=1 Tax=Portunus trituberculatus TaxID=210409 RepID=A0A5B7CG57_PORTR|nr:hypothetical protein [Portunus trituberculatus]
MKQIEAGSMKFFLLSLTQPDAGVPCLTRDTDAGMCYWVLRSSAISAVGRLLLRDRKGRLPFLAKDEVTELTAA